MSDTATPGSGTSGGVTDAITVAEPGPPPDPRDVVEDLQRRLLVERERSLNSVDAVLGARAKAAQARAENKELQYRLHVREAELSKLKELMAEREGGPDPTIPRGRPTSGGTGEVVELARAARALVNTARARVRRR